MLGKFLDRYKLPVLLVDLVALVLLSMFMRSQLDKRGLWAAILALAAFVVFVFSLYIFAKIGSPMFSGYLANKIARNIVFPQISSEECVLDHSMIQAKIARGEIDSAASELKEALLANPSDERAVELLCVILADHEKDYVNAVGLLAGHLRKDSRRDSDLPFVMRLADIYLDGGFDDKAISLLMGELERKGYTNKGRQGIDRRLQGLGGSA